MPVEISVVVCTRNRPLSLHRCIQSLLRQAKSPKEIIVVDDATDHGIANSITGFLSGAQNSVAGIVSGTRIELKYIRSRKRQGTTRSRNMGIAAATGDVVAFIDDDGYAHRNWLKNLALCYTAGGVVGAGGPVVEKGRKVEVRKGFRRLSYITRYGDIRHNYRVSAAGDLKNLWRGGVRFLMGGNMSFRRETLAKIGGFSRHYKGNYYREETDLCLRMSRRGKIIFEPSAIAYHDTGKSGGTRDVFFLRDFLYWYFRNTSLLFFSHFNPAGALRKIYFHNRKYIRNILSKSLVTDRNILSKSLVTDRNYLIAGPVLTLLAAVVFGTFAGILAGVFFGRHMKKISFSRPEYIIVMSLAVAGSSIMIYDTSVMEKLLPE